MPAVLEQWEIDLRNQLLEGSQSEREWEERFRNELRDVPPRKTPRKNKPTRDNNMPSRFENKAKKTKKDGYFGYYLVILCLIVAAGFVYNQKSNGAITSWVQNRIQISTPDRPVPQNPTLPSMPPDKSSEVAQLQVDVAKIKQDMDTLTGKVKWNSDRITLMGILLNENFVIMSNNYDRSHLIFFNADWTIDKMPRYLEIQEKDKEYLQKFVKPR
jgi:hypothetical protein